MKVHALGSGSAGNAIILETGRQRILVDAGFGVRELATRMKALDVHPASVSALVVTHEHGDHDRGAIAAARRWGWPIYGTAGTLSRLRDSRRERRSGSLDDRTCRGGSTDSARATESTVGHTTPARRSLKRHVIDIRRELSLDDLTVRFFRTPHDASEPVALVATSRSTGERVGIAYDIGHVTESLVRHLSGLDILLLESNHDDAMLRSGPYPWPVKQRIAGPLGHLSNVEAASIARSCAHARLRHLLLCHISRTNNTPERALAAVRGALRGTGYRGTLRAASQDEPVTLGRAVQMELALRP